MKTKIGKIVSLVICVVMVATVFAVVATENANASSSFFTVVALEQLTTDIAKDADPAWSPNGSKIVFESERSGSTDIWVMNSDGSNQQRLTYWPEFERFPKYSPDGAKIVFMRGYLPHYDIWVMNADGSNPVQLTTDLADDRIPCWTPDGSKIVFESFRSGGGDIWIMNADGTNKVRLTTDPTRDAHPWVSPDGSKIAFMSVRTGDWEIWVMNIDGSGQQQLTFEPGGDMYPTWRYDGSMIAFARGYEYETDLWVMSADGTNKQQLTFVPGDDSIPAWSPVEDKIAFRSTRSENWDVWVMTLGIEPTVSISTDSFEYSPGDTMTTTLSFKNPTTSSVDTYFIWYFGLPDYGFWTPMLATPFTLPPNFDQSYTMSIPIGNWGSVGFEAMWYVALLEPSYELISEDIAGWPHEIISEDTADWRYVPAVRAQEGKVIPEAEEIAKEITKEIEGVEFAT